MNIKNNFLTIQFNKYKCITGIVLAVLSLLVCILSQQYGAGGVLTALSVLFGCFNLKTQNRILPFVLMFLWTCVVAFVTVQAPAYTISVTEWMSVSPRIICLNYLCVFMVFMFFLIITAKPRLSVLLGALFLMLLATLNGFVFQFRGRELGFSDIFSFQTAINVAGQYHPLISQDLLMIWCHFIVVVFVGFSLPPLPISSRYITRLVALVATICLWLPLNPYTKDVPIKTWASESTRLNGFYLNVYMSIRDSAMKKPESYNPQSIEQLAQQYLAQEPLEEETKRPNILVIMNESFADLTVFGDLKTSQTVTPFLNGLKENTIRGYALTSVYGGNTANAEFEFLTGHSMAFFPEFSVPYQQYIRRETNTLAKLLASYGYKSMATHPYYENGWSRNRIYPLFGFEESTFIDAYETRHPVREYISDRDMYDYVLNLLKNKDDDRPLFLFGITMQNHGGYDYSGENFKESIQLNDYAGSYPMATQYINLLHESDNAAKYLFNQLKNFKEDTVVLFFGDHLAMVEAPFYEEVYGGKFITLPEKELHYQVPFYIWANYDIPEETIPCTSLNYLATHLLKAAGLPLSPYLRYLEDVEKEIPAINTRGYYSVAEKTFLPLEDAVDKEAAALQQYASLTYNQLFDKKNRNSLFFP